MKILVLDDNFPNPLSGFRVAEYNFYFDVFPMLSVACSSQYFETYSQSYEKFYPDYIGRYRPMSLVEDRVHDLCYMNFLNNAHVYLKYVEAIATPFIFTLYPGGGFELDNQASLGKLTTVLCSPLLRGVISTQRVTTAVLKKMRCNVPIHEIYGAAINPIYTIGPACYPSERHGGRLAICFAAFNYGDQGRSKGYPQFIALAELLLERGHQVELAVVGNYSPDDVTLSPQLSALLRFHGPLDTLELRRFFGTQDAIVSPNTPYRVTGSQFDGFPTATCVEASLCGVAMVCADELQLNTHYAEDEIIVCETDPQSILAAISPFLTRPDALRQIGERGRAKSLRLFSSAAQLVPRAQVLRDAATRRGRPAGWRYGSAER